LLGRQEFSRLGWQCFLISPGGCEKHFISLLTDKNGLTKVGLTETDWARPPRLSTQGRMNIHICHDVTNCEALALTLLSRIWDSLQFFSEFFNYYMILIALFQQSTVSLCRVNCFEGMPKDEIRNIAFRRQKQQFSWSMMPTNDKQGLVENLARYFSLDPKVMKDRVF
jgi:hypothetical protein